MSDRIEQVTEMIERHWDETSDDIAQQIDQLYRKDICDRLVEIFSKRAMWGNARAIKAIKQELQSDD